MDILIANILIARFHCILKKIFGPKCSRQTLVARRLNDTTACHSSFPKACDINST
jgi:hypothetical protein